jgi:hypothetical protein
MHTAHPMTIRHRLRSLTISLSALLGACTWLPRPEVLAPRPAPTLDVFVRPSSQRRTDNVIVVTIDGVRWQDVFGGVDPAMATMASVPANQVVDAATLLPNLYAFAREGVVSGAPGHGKPMMASGPNYVSLPGYLEIFSGSTRVGCRTNGCDPTTKRTFFDRARDEVAASDRDVAIISSWEKIAFAATAAPERLTVSAGRHGGASRGNVRLDRDLAKMVDDAAESAPAPGHDDYRADAHTAAIALRYLERARPRVLAVGLGDTDEHAHAGDYASYLAALRQADRFLGDLRATLARMGSYGAHTTVVVTCDHGRSAGFNDHGWDSPESGRVWMIAAGGAVPALGYLDEGGAERLADIAPTLEGLLGMASPSDEPRGTLMAALASSVAPRYVARAAGGTALYR